MNFNFDSNLETPLDRQARYVATMTGLDAGVGLVAALGIRSKKPMKGGLYGATFGFVFSNVILGLEGYRGQHTGNTPIAIGVASAYNYLAFGPHRRPLYRLPLAAASGALHFGLAFAATSLLDKFDRAHAATETSV